MLIKITSLISFGLLIYISVVAVKYMLSRKPKTEQDIAMGMAARQFKLLKQIHTAYHAPFEDRPALIQSFKQCLNDFMQDVDAEVKRSNSAEFTTCTIAKKEDCTIEDIRLKLVK